MMQKEEGKNEFPLIINSEQFCSLKQQAELR